MMTRNPYARAYHHTAAYTASPGKLTLMLFDGAMRFIGTALSGFEETNHIRRNELVHNNIAKVQAILTELQATLNMEAGGEFASTMYRLYDFMQEQLRVANIQKSLEPIQVVQRFLGEIRDAWSQMLSQQENVVTNDRLAAAC